MGRDGASQHDGSAESTIRRNPRQNPSGPVNPSASSQSTQRDVETEYSEDAPLLGPRKPLNSRDSGPQLESGESQGALPDWDDNYHEFDHLPWYKKPSV